MTREAEIAWAAGIFEGEGYMGIPTESSSRYQGLRMKVTMTDFDVVERFHEVVDAGYLKEHKHQKGSPEHWKPQLAWLAAGADAVYVISMLRPYFGERRSERALECLTWFRLRFVKVCGGCGQTYVAANAKSTACTGRCRKRLSSGYGIERSDPLFPNDLFASSPRRERCLDALADLIGEAV